jgi:hypothetical protein
MSHHSAVLECSSSLTALRMLVVDNEADTRVLLRAMLEQCGSEVMTATLAAGALAVFEQWRPDMLVSDIGTPEEDDYALIDRVRSSEAGCGGRVPALALTSYARAEDRMHALKAVFRLMCRSR